MKQNRTDRQDSDRSSPAQSARDTACDNDRMSGSEKVRNRESSGPDLGSSSDRAMFADRDSSESRDVSSDHGIPGERGSGASGERNSSGPSGMKRGTDNAGGITNRELDREQLEQDQLPERGRSQSER